MKKKNKSILARYIGGKGGRALGADDALRGAGSRERENTSVFLSPVHVCVGDESFICPLVPGGVGGERDALHVLQVHVEIVAVPRSDPVLFTVEERQISEGGMELVSQHLDDLLKRRTQLRVVVPTHLHQTVTTHKHTHTQRLLYLHDNLQKHILL